MVVKLFCTQVDRLDDGSDQISGDFEMKIKAFVFYGAFVDLKMSDRSAAASVRS